MKAIISTNYEPTYLFFAPITAWAWKKLGVDVRFLMPFGKIGVPEKYLNQSQIIGKRLFELVLRNITQTEHNKDLSVKILEFTPPTENHEVTYTQVSRLFAAADTSIPDNEILITSDCDMLVFQVPPHDLNGVFSVFGADLVPPKQFPMCYVTATAAAWRKVFVKGRALQECLDDALAAENSIHMRSDLWCRDQELLYNGINLSEGILYFNRAYEGTQFATKRYDRDDAYLLDRLSFDTVDFHCPRPGYEEKNFEIILKVLQYHYPLDSFDWVREYAAEFRSILNQ